MNPRFSTKASIRRCGSAFALFRCERPLGHDGPHARLSGERVWWMWSDTELERQADEALLVRNSAATFDWLAPKGGVQ